MRNKLKSQKAETLIEALTSLLIVVLSMGLLSTCVMTAAGINKQTREQDEAYSQNLQIAEGLIEDGYTAKDTQVEIRFSKEAAKKVTVKLYGKEDSEFIAYKYIAEEMDP